MAKSPFAVKRCPGLPDDERKEEQQALLLHKLLRLWNDDRRSHAAAGEHQAHLPRRDVARGERKGDRRGGIALLGDEEAHRLLVHLVVPLSFGILSVTGFEQPSQARPQSSVTEPRTAPAIIMVVADTLRADVMSAWGDAAAELPLAQTPVLERWLDQFSRGKELLLLNERLKRCAVEKRGGLLFSRASS